MLGTGPFSAYSDIATFQAAGLGIAINPYVGANSVLTGGIAAGVSSLPVVSSAGAGVSQPCYILDGPNSEIVFTDPTTPTPDGTHIKLAGVTQFPHGANASVSTPGTGNRSLAEIILAASSEIENYCEHGSIGDRGLYTTQRTEKLKMPTSRAFLDSSYGLNLYPTHFPIIAVASLAIEYAPGYSISLDTSQIEIDASDRLHSIKVPVLKPTASGGVSPYWLNSGFINRSDDAWAVFTYTAGVPYPAVPVDLVKACNFWTQELLSYRFNPTGAAMIRQGEIMIEQRMRGSGGREASTDGVFITQAKYSLRNYRNEFA